jgi:hypothetical protein
MARRTEPPQTTDSSKTKPMSDMDPDGMDSELEGEGDLDSADDAMETSPAGGQHARQTDTTSSQDKASQRRSHQAGDHETDDEEDEDVEPSSTPRSASQQPHNRRESDRNRPPQSGDRRR